MDNFCGAMTKKVGSISTVSAKRAQPARKRARNTG